MSPARRRGRFAPETLVWLRSDEWPDTHAVISRIEERGGHVLHILGPRLLVVARLSAKAIAELRHHPNVSSTGAKAPPRGASETEGLGARAWDHRQSPGFQKKRRPRSGQAWNAVDEAGEPCRPPTPPLTPGVFGAPDVPIGDMSPYLIGSVGVGLVFVNGPTAPLAFTPDEQLKAFAEVQNGLHWLAQQEPRASVTWSTDVKTVAISSPVDPSASGFEPLERVWRDPALAALGYGPGDLGIRSYVSDLRGRLGTRWGYMGFFVKYPLGRFAYSRKPAVIVNFENGPWGPDNIDRTFTHETGHIFGCPDEYGDCACSDRFGFLRERNGNCEACAADLANCLMDRNDWALCSFTRVHLGWRDQDGDGTLDPVDPVAHPAVQLSNVQDELRAHEILGAPFPPYGPTHAAVPLFLLRRVLPRKEMERVLEAVREEDRHYMNRLEQKVLSAARTLRRSRSSPHGQ